VIFSDSFLPCGTDRRALSVKVASTQTTVKYAQELLEKIEEPTPSGSYDDIKRVLDRMQGIIQEARKNLDVASPRPRSLLSSMKIPKQSPPPIQTEMPPTIPEAELLPGEDQTLLSPTIRSPSQALDDLPGSSAAPLHFFPLGSFSKESNDPLSSSTKSALPSRPAFLTTSLETQEELSAQLAQMGHQLKLNAIHLSNSLAKEKGTIEDATEKLDHNLGTMTKERVRLRDHSGKSGSTTWLVLGAILCVIIAWIVMFFIIRLT